MITGENTNSVSKKVIVGNLETIISQYFRRAINTDASDIAENYRKSAYEIVESLFTNDENVVVSGDADDFHNLAVTFAKEDDYETALEIVKKGLTVHKTNTDLLADAIKYGSNCGVYDECDEWCKQLNRVTKRKWTWRAYSFTIDYLVDCLDRMDEISDEQFDAEKLKILALVKEYQDVFYDMEDSWYSEFEVYWKLNERRTAKEILQKISQMEMKCPKAWLRYADILMDDGELDQAEKMLKRLKCDDSDSSYAYYLDGRCRLGKILRNDAFASENIDEKIQNEIHGAYRSFALAWRMNPAPGLKEKIRTAVRRLYLESEIGPLPQYRIEDYGMTFDDFD